MQNRTEVYANNSIGETRGTAQVQKWWRKVERVVEHKRQLAVRARHKALMDT